jgi:hypothetical protein
MMSNPAQAEYLRRYPFLRTCELDESRAVMSEVWGEHKVTPTSRTPFATAINHAQVGKAGLTFVDCRASMPSVAPPSRQAPARH